MPRYKTHYQILGVSPDASERQIREAFRKLSKIHHPDRNHNSEASTRIFKVLINSYRTLSDAEQRKEYDSFLNQSRYFRSYGKSEKPSVSGPAGFDPRDLLERIHMTLWEVEDFLDDFPLTENARIAVLTILTHLDRWILEPYGFPDYFYEARRQVRADPRDYIQTLGKAASLPGHSPYHTVKEYFYDIRRRSDRFINRYENLSRWEAPVNKGTPLVDAILEYHALAVHFLTILFRDKKSF